MATKKLTLNETWVLCLRMWRWIARQKRAGSRKSVDELKHEWLIRNGFGDETIEYDIDIIENDCFFCEYGSTHKKSVKNYSGIGCPDCPAVFIDNQFSCDNEKYCWDRHPIPFYNKLVSLNRKRLKPKRKG